MLAFKVDDMTIQQVTGIISASSVLIAYIIGEGMVDAAREKSNVQYLEIKEYIKEE